MTLADGTTANDPDDTIEGVIDDTIDHTVENTVQAERPKRDKAARLERKLAMLREADAARARKAADADADGAASRDAAVRRWITSTVVLGTLVVLLAGTVGVGLPWVLHQRALNGARSAVLPVAQRYAVDFGSYDYRHLDTDFALVQSHLTPGFAKDYQSVSASLKQTIVQYKGVSAAKVQGAAVVSLDGPRKADVLVFLDQTVSSAQSKTPRIDRNRLQLTLQKQKNGDWLISGLALK